MSTTTMCFKLFTGLAAMSFLWVGSQIPLYLFGALLPDIYTDIGGAERYQWMVIGYLIPNASLCPFVGALSDMFGRRWVAAGGQVLLIRWSNRHRYSQYDERSNRRASHFWI